MKELMTKIWAKYLDRIMIKKIRNCVFCKPNDKFKLILPD